MHKAEVERLLGIMELGHFIRMTVWIPYWQTLHSFSLRGYRKRVPSNCQKHPPRVFRFSRCVRPPGWIACALSASHVHAATSPDTRSKLHASPCDDGQSKSASSKPGKICNYDYEHLIIRCAFLQSLANCTWQFGSPDWRRPIQKRPDFLQNMQS